MNEPIRVLLVEDNPGDAHLMRELLPRNGPIVFELEHTPRLAIAIELIRTDNFDVILLDLALPDSLGLDTVTEMRKKTAKIPIIVLTGTDDERTGLAAIQEGAQDYLIKGQIGSALLVRTIRYAMERGRAEEQRLKLEARAQNALKLEAIGTLASGIAHDFNNLLSGFFGQLEMAQVYLKERDLNHVSEALIQAINVLDRAKGLTNQLLVFSKDSVPITKVTDISEHLKRIATFALSGSNITQEIFIAEDLWPCAIDKNQFAQAIDNLLRNAKEAMPNGGTITINAENLVSAVSLSKLLTPGRYIRITIKDSGSGISEENLQRIFDPYFTTKEHGHGLGLGMVFSVIKKHGGIIEAESKIGEGSVFYIYLPAANELLKRETKKQIEYNHTGAKILIMDDEKLILDFVQGILEKIGYEVKCASSGEAAISLYQQSLEESQPFDLVILDITVRGGMGGKETLSEIQKLDPTVKAIVSSGYANDPVMANPKAYGFRGSISKPYLTEELQDALSKALDDTTKSCDGLTAERP